MNWKTPLFRMIFFLTLLLPGIAPAQAQSPFLAGTVSLHGAIITDFFQNHNSDDDFGHYATGSGGKFLSTVNESWFSLSGGFGEINGIKTTVEASFDFMGDNGFEIVSAWIRLERGKGYFLAGKAENLVATGETSLNYDGFYSAGGIQTGAHANQNQLQIGYKATDKLTLALSATDEPAQNGSTDGRHFSSEHPAVEAALFFESRWGSGKIAGHRGSMRFPSGEHFYPSLIMGEVNIPISTSFSAYMTAFRASAGSQFFTIDTLFDRLVGEDGQSDNCDVRGGMAELLYRRDGTEAWLGVGRFSLADSSAEQLRFCRVSDAITDNHRFSLGTRHNFSPHLRGGAELTRYRTRHLKGTEQTSVSAMSVQFQLSLLF